MNVQNLSFPVTKIQEQLIWLANKSQGGSLAYNILQTLMLEGRLDRGLMRQVLLELTQRHQALRSSVETQTHLQRVHNDVVLDAKLVDMSNVVQSQQEAEYQAWLTQEKGTLFDLETAPLVRFRFVKLAEEKHILVIIAHHVVCDGWSLGILVSEIAKAYSLKYTGSYQSLAPAMQFSEYVALITQQEAIAQRRLKNLAYWFEKYKNGAPVLNLPTDYSRPKVRTFQSFYLHRDISDTCITQLRKLGGKCGSTLFMVFYSAFALTLHRYSQQKTLLIGVPSSGRLEPNTDTIVGYLGAVLPLLSQYDPQENIEAFIRRQKSTLLDAYQYEDFSFADLVEALPFERAENRSALIDVIFNLQPSVNLQNDTELSMTVGFEPSTHVAYDIFLNITDYQGHFAIDVDFNADIFSRTRANAFIDSYVAVLAHCVDYLNAPIKRVPMLNAASQQRLVHTWNAPTAPIACRDISLSQAIEACVAHYPNRIALVCEQTRVSFATYNAKANQLARELQQQGMGLESRIGVCLTRTEITYISFFAILKLGAAFVPLDPTYPQKRLQKIIELAGVDLVLIDKQTEAVVDGLSGNARAHVACYYLESLKSVAHHASDNLEVVVAPETLAYLIYTSGSTGEPKGVAIRNKSVVAMLDAVRALPAIHDDEVWLTVNSLSFDICILENFYPMVFGGTLVIGQRDWIFNPAHLHQVAKNENVSMCVATPSMWRLMFSQPEAVQQRFKIITGGEALGQTQALELTQFADHIWNFYGPTEATVWASCHPVNQQGLAQATETHVLVGKPLTHYQFYIVDENLELVPPGVPGFLLIGGEGLARGYWHAPAITANSFIPDPFSGVPGARLYNTGDIARYQADGSVEYLSRADDQIKVRGFRIELGEVESAIHAFSGVNNAVVIGVQDEADVSSHKLAAYVESHDPQFSLSALSRHLKDSLPAYMVPSSIQQVSEIKLTESRKVDRSALPKPDFSFAKDVAITPASTAAEKALSQIWGAVLKVDTPDIHSSFFEMGGHSLMATQLVDYINRSGYFTEHATLSDVFNYPNIAHMAQHFDAALTDAARHHFPQQNQPNNPFLNPDFEGEFEFEIKTNPDARFEPFPLTELQQAYWIGRSSAVALGNAESYNYSAVTLEADYAQRVEAAWNKLIARHDMLRMQITDEGRQQVMPEAPHYVVEQDDLSLLSADEQRQSLTDTRLAMTFYHQAHAQPDNYALRLSKLNNHTYCLHILLSMMVFDGASLRIIFDELTQLLEAPDSEFEPLSLGFRDCVLSHCQIEQTEGYQAAKAYWQGRAATLPDAPKLPLVKDLYAIKRPYLSREKFTLDKHAWQALKHQAAKQSITPSVLAFTLLAELLGAWSNSRHFCVNLTLFNRLGKHPQLNRVVGDFTSTTLLEVNRQKNHSFVQAAKANQAQLLLDIQHRHYGGVNVLRDMNQARGDDSQVIMPIVFTSDLSIEFEGRESPLAQRFNAFSEGISLTPQVLMDFMVMEHEGDFIVTADYLKEAFPEALIPSLIEQYGQVLQALATSDETWQQTHINACPKWQLQQREAVNNVTDYHQHALLHTGFENQAHATPDAVAIINPDGSELSYAQVNGAASYLADLLIVDQLEPNQLVAVLFEKGWQQTVATLAILKAGGAYLPLNADAPPSLLASILQQSGAQRLVTLTQWSLLPELAETKVKNFHLTSDFIGKQGTKTRYHIQSPASLAYVIYTSGSTGKPKGVALNHTGPVNTNDSINALLNIGANDRVLALSALSFDLSVYDIFGVLSAGGAIVYPDAKKERDPAHWHELVSQHQVSVWNTVPALMQIYADYLGAEQQALAASLRHVMMSGDWLPVNLPTQLRMLAGITDVNDPRLNLYSLGGATEASIWSIYYPIKAIDPNWKSIPYGKPLPNQQYYVLDEDLNPCPNYVVGDLYIGGVGLAQGYFNDAIKTQESFITVTGIGAQASENTAQTPLRLYRTGDTGCYLNDGNIEFFGRKDTQVKVQGYRVELGQIEHNINEHPDVKDCVVLAEGERAKNKRLVAYVMRQSKLAQKAVEAKAAQDAGAESETPTTATPQKGVTSSTEEAAKALFKLSRKGLRTDVDVQQGIAFAPLLAATHLGEAAFGLKPQAVLLNYHHAIGALARTNSASTQALQAVSLTNLFCLLASLCETPVEQAPLPKYFYPSSGSLNPVQTYVEVNQTLEDARLGLRIETGMYYLNTLHWSLHLVAHVDACAVSNASMENRASQPPPLRIHLVGLGDAILPLYDSHSKMLCSVEAGYMDALLDGVAQAHGVVMQRHIHLESDSKTHSVNTLTQFGLQQTGWLLSCMDVLGEVNLQEVVQKNAQAHPQSNLQSDLQLKAQAWPNSYLTDTSENLSLGIFERQSYRRYDADAFDVAALETLLQHVQLNDASLALCVYLKQAVNGVHYFCFDTKAQTLQALDTHETKNLGQHTRGNQAVEAQSDFSIFLVSIAPLGSEQSRCAPVENNLYQWHLCGQVGQRLLALAPKLGLGLCPIGWVNDAQLMPLLRLHQNAATAVLHSFIGGSITPEQTQVWGELEDMKAATAQGVTQVTQGGSEQLIQQIKSYLERTLAPYMVPQVYRLIDSLPLTANGKVDRKRMSSMPFEEFTGKSFVAPSNALQKQIAALWCSTLNIEKVGVDEHFFAVGGSSVTLIGMASLFKKEMGISLDIIDLFNYPTVGALAEFIGNQDSAKAQVSEQFNKKQEKAAKQRQRAASARRHSRGAKRGESS